MSRPALQAIPCTYKAVTFRSTLEADWAHTLDRMGMRWAYEPEGLRMGKTWYRPDFHLPGTDTWLEVKGIGIPRVEKASELQEACIAGPEGTGDPDWPWQLVVVGRPAKQGRMSFHGAPCRSMPDPKIVISKCEHCKQLAFADQNGRWKCRRCWSENGGVVVFEAAQLGWWPIDHEAGQSRARRAKKVAERSSKAS